MRLWSMSCWVWLDGLWINTLGAFDKLLKHFRLSLELALLRSESSSDKLQSASSVEWSIPNYPTSEDPIPEISFFLVLFVYCFQEVSILKLCCRFRNQKSGILELNLPPSHCSTVFLKTLEAIHDSGSR